MKIFKKEQMKQTVMFDEVFNAVQTAPNSVIDMRLSPFSPLDRANKSNPIYKAFTENNGVLNRDTEYGWIEIRSRVLLTQRHRDVFNCILNFSDRSKQVVGGRTALYFTKATLIKHLGWKKGGYAYTNLVRHIQEITDTTIERVISDCYYSNYHIFDKFAYSPTEESFGVVLSEEYSGIFQTLPSVNISKRLDELLAIQGYGSALIKASIEFMMSHSANENKPYRIGIEKLLNNINFITESKRKEREARDIFTAYIETLEKFNIHYFKKDRYFEYFGADKIFFVQKSLKVVQ